MSVYSKEIRVRLQDVDAAGIVFFARVFEYCHDTYFEMLSDGGLDLPGQVKNGPVLLPLVHCEADFKKPMRFGDRLRVSIVSATVRRSSFEVCYEVADADDPEKIRCTARTIHAVVDRESFRPLAEVPESICRALRIS